MHDWAGFHCHDGFWSRSAVAQFTVWSLGVVVYPPLLDQDLSLTEAVEDLAIEQFIPHPPVKAFAVSVFPRTARQGIAWQCPERGDPGSM